MEWSVSIYTTYAIPIYKKFQAYVQYAHIPQQMRIVAAKIVAEETVAHGNINLKFFTLINP